MYSIAIFHGLINADLILVWSLSFAMPKFRFFLSQIRGGTYSKTEESAQKAIQSQYKAGNDFANIARILYASWVSSHYDFACEWHIFFLQRNYVKKLNRF